MKFWYILIDLERKAFDIEYCYELGAREFMSFPMLNVQVQRT
jgi:hypothetical protein